MDTPTRRLRILLPVLAVALLLAACDDPTKLSPDEQRIVVGAESLALCWDQESGEATTRVLATVFGEDGSVAQNTRVSFTSDWAGATLTPAEIGTDETGRAIVELTTTRPDGDKLTVTGTLPDGRSDDITIQVPAPPMVQFVPEAPEVPVGSEFYVYWFITGPCNLSRITARLEWDPEVLEYLPGEWEELGIFNAPVEADGDDTGDTGDTGDAGETDDDGDGSAGSEPETIPTVVEEMSGDGWVLITYRRDDTPRTGTSATGSYLRIRFRALATGDAGMTATRVELAPPDDRPFEMTDENWAALAITIVDAEGDGSEDE